MNHEQPLQILLTGTQRLLFNSRVQFYTVTHSRSSGVKEIESKFRQPAAFLGPQEKTESNGNKTIGIYSSSDSIVGQKCVPTTLQTCTKVCPAFYAVVMTFCYGLPKSANETRY
jgi:hypothetical protein